MDRTKQLQEAAKKLSEAAQEVMKLDPSGYTVAITAFQHMFPPAVIERPEYLYIQDAITTHICGEGRHCQHKHRLDTGQEVVHGPKKIKFKGRSLDSDLDPACDEPIDAAEDWWAPSKKWHC